MIDIQTPFDGIHSKLEDIRTRLSADETYCSINVRMLRDMFYYPLNDPIDVRVYFPLTNQLDNEQDTSWE